MKAYTHRPVAVTSGIIRMVLCILKYLLKKLNIKSMPSWVQKFTRTRVPRRVYEIPYISLNVANNSGGKLNTEDVARDVK